MFQFGPQLAVLIVLLVWAVHCDLRQRRIPNWVVVSLLVAGLLAQGFGEGLRALGSAAAAFLLVGALLWLPWRKGWLGGGDLKLAAALGCWTGLDGLPTFLLSAAVAGGLLSAACWYLSSAPTRAEIGANLLRVRVGGGLSPVAPDNPGRVAVPYALALAIGALVAFGLGGWR